MVNTSREIKQAFDGGLEIFEFYADDYDEERKDDIFNDVIEADEAFQQRIKELGMKAMPISNYVNPIMNKYK